MSSTTHVSTTTATTPRADAASARRTRFGDVLAGRTPDRIPVTAWQHHIPAESDVVALADAIAAEVTRYGWDWVKVNPRATYLPEAFGNVYDLSDYDGVLPRASRVLLHSVADLHLVRATTTAHSLTEHVRLIELLRERLPAHPLLPTVFSPLSVLLALAGVPSYATALPTDEPGVSDGTATRLPVDLLAQWVADDSEAVHAALQAIADTLVDYLAATTLAGADGVFYAVTGTANPAITTPELFAELSTPYDDAVLGSVSGWRVLHTCGAHADPARFDRAGVDAIHWDATADGNPHPGEIFLRAAIVGGYSHEAAGRGDLDVVTAQVRDALTSPAPFLLAPSCSVPPTVPAGVYEAVAALSGTAG
ncbi:uroporphyrinogen decarboxylase [Salana multivorans]|uniref:Uroporphyrinogen decarboxylase n=1 Tax=Salana multivorans TaxID=120377 RepID=A0A3N2D967_9MICO|nr:uroporphyrinogen decarboxylase family protein [Salana multivorans]ROR96337.1 uroporphyrinogen decarboxylase [Salana multivorans]